MLQKGKHLLLHRFVILITLIYGILLLLFIIEQNKTYNYPRCGGSDYHVDIVKHFKDRDYRDHM
jgi:hypothetical protein